MLAAEPDNLVLRAARALAEAAGIAAGARLTLDKHLPVASGIGGGSADAAAALRLLSALWGVQADLPALAARLGADVPVCLAAAATDGRRGRAALAPRRRCRTAGIVLVNPGGSVATAAGVPGAARPITAHRAALPAAWPDAGGDGGRSGGLRNDLEQAAQALHPPIGDGAGGAGGRPGLPARAHERLRRDLLRPVRRAGRRDRARRRPWRGPAGGAGAARCKARA